MNEKLECPNKPRLCEFPKCREKCFQDEGQKRTAELAKKRPYLLRMKTITR